MITTLPGLYSVSWVSIAILERTLSAVGLLSETGPDSILCSTSYLRGQNIVLLAAVFVLLHKILALEGERAQVEGTDGADGKSNEQSNGRDRFIHVLEALNLSTFPLLSFFACLYYTDMGATCFVLLGYYQALSGQHLSSALVGVVASRASIPSGTRAHSHVTHTHTHTHSYIH